MSYNSFLDTYFSSWWFGLGVPLVFMLILIVFSKQIYRRKDYTFGMRTINIAVPFVFAITSALINPMYLGYGHPAAIDEIRMINGRLIVMDHILTLGTRGADPDAYMRVHVLNAENGSKIIRFPAGNGARLIGIHGDSLSVARFNDVAYFSVTNGKQYVVYNTETLPKLFPELSTGVDNFMWCDDRNIMEMSSNDGKKWDLFTATGKLITEDAKRAKSKIATYNIYIESREIRREEETGDKVIVQLSGKGENQNQMYVTNREDSILNENLIFLVGLPVGIDIKDSCFFILHYETLKKERFILSCVTLDGKKVVWEIKQTQFNADYTYPEVYAPHVGVDETSGKVFFSIDKEIFAVNIKDGKLLWRTKL